MTSRLSPCPRCNRHIRITEASCPFCGTESASSLRAQATALFTGVALLAGCGNKPEEKPKPTPIEVRPAAGIEVPDAPREVLYGAPPPRPGPDPTPSTTTAPTSMAEPPKKPIEKQPKPLVPERETKDIYGGPPPIIDSPGKIYGAPPIEGPRLKPTPKAPHIEIKPK